jgi:hypothetical protein
VFVREPTADGVVDAIRQHRTVAVAPDGSVFGPPELAASLEAEPLAPRPVDYAYRGDGWLDRVTRSLGFLGTLALVVLRGRKDRDRGESGSGA